MAAEKNIKSLSFLQLLVIQNDTLNKVGIRKKKKMRSNQKQNSYQKSSWGS